MLKLYYRKGVYSLAPKILLKESGLPFEALEITEDYKTPTGSDFYALSPMGKVPTLETPEGVLVENAAILPYIADLVPEKRLSPPKDDAFARARMHMWHSLIAAEFQRGASPLMRLWDKDFGGSAETRDAILESAFGRPLKLLTAHINKVLGTQPFLLGGHFTSVDAHLFAGFRICRGKSWFPSKAEECTHIEAHFQRLLSRESVSSAMREEGLEAR